MYISRSELIDKIKYDQRLCNIKDDKDYIAAILTRLLVSAGVQTNIYTMFISDTDLSQTRMVSKIIRQQREHEWKSIISLYS